MKTNEDRSTSPRGALARFDGCTNPRSCERVVSAVQGTKPGSKAPAVRVQPYYLMGRIWPLVRCSGRKRAEPGIVSKQFPKACVLVEGPSFRAVRPCGQLKAVDRFKPSRSTPLPIQWGDYSEMLSLAKITSISGSPESL